MHELAVTESILEIAVRRAQEAGAGRITDLHLAIGDLSSIVDDSIQFYWDIISQGTLAAGARLHFRRVSARLTCLDCGTAYTLSGELSACPLCEGFRVKVLAGDEFQLESIDVELADAFTPERA